MHLGPGGSQAAFTKVPGWGWTGNRLGAEMLSAYDWLGVPWWGSEKGLQWSRPLCKVVQSPRSKAVEGAWDRARSLARLPRGRGAQDPLQLSRQHPLFASPYSGVAALAFQPHGAGRSPSHWIRDGAFGADPHFKQSYNREKCGFTRNVGDYLLYISTFHSTKGFTYFV